MRTILKALTILSFIINCLIGQFYSDLPKNTSPSSLNRGKDDNLNFYSHSNKFNINHGFSMSMMSNGQNLYSVSEFNNHISYQLLDGLMLDANIGLFMMQSPMQNKNQIAEQFSMAYDASIIYKPTENSVLQLRLQNLPYHQRQQYYSPFNLRFNQ